MATITVPRGKQHIVPVLPHILRGEYRDEYGIRKEFISTFTYSLMSQIGDAFLAKSNGGTDNLGHTFRPLHPTTVKKKSSKKFHKKYPLTLPHQIMRASGNLIRSYSAGTFEGERYLPPKNQVVRIRESLIKIYSKLPYAEYQFAKRPFWPNDITPWITKALDTAIQAVNERLERLP